MANKFKVESAKVKLNSIYEKRVSIKKYEYERGVISSPSYPSIYFNYEFLRIGEHSLEIRMNIVVFHDKKSDIHCCLMTYGNDMILNDELVIACDYWINYLIKEGEYQPPKTIKYLKNLN